MEYEIRCGSIWILEFIRSSIFLAVTRNKNMYFFKHQMKNDDFVIRSNSFSAFFFPFFFFVFCCSSGEMLFAWNCYASNGNWQICYFIVCCWYWPAYKVFFSFIGLYERWNVCSSDLKWLRARMCGITHIWIGLPVANRNTTQYNILCKNRISFVKFIKMINWITSSQW